MIEIPEAVVLSEQINKTIAGKRINRAAANSSPHKFAWYFQDPKEYGSFLSGRKVLEAKPYAGRVSIFLEGGAELHFADGVCLRFLEPETKLPDKHQLLVEFEDNSFLLATVAMYGGLWALPGGAMDDNLYYTAAKNAVSPLTPEFDYNFFLKLFDEKGLKMSAKAFLATEQRIPGLGNGVLHDILLNAGIHPKRKAGTFTEEEKRQLFDSVKSTLKAMADGGGRDTEKDLLGNAGGYKTMLSKNNTLMICPKCGGAVKKEAYLGGSIYYCPQCQK